MGTGGEIVYQVCPFEERPSRSMSFHLPLLRLCRSVFPTCILSGLRLLDRRIYSTVVGYGLSHFHIRNTGVIFSEPDSFPTFTRN